MFKNNPQPQAEEPPVATGKERTSCLSSLSSNEIVLSVTAAAIALADGLSANETAILGAVFTQLGDTLTTISTVRSSA